MNGHSQRAVLPGTLSDHLIDIDIDLNKTLPAFTYCSLDENPGDGDPAVGDACGYAQRLPALAAGGLDRHGGASGR